MERKIKMKATSRSIKILNRSVRGHSKRISACLVGRPKDSYAGAGEADPRRAAEGEALAAGKRAAALAGRSARGTVRRLGRKDAKEVAEAREERSRARAVGRRGPRIPTAACRDVGAASVHSDGRREALAPSGAPRLADRQRRRAALLVMVRVLRARRVVRVLRELVRQRVRLHRGRGDPEVRRLLGWGPVVQVRGAMA